MYPTSISRKSDNFNTVFRSHLRKQYNFRSRVGQEPLLMSCFCKKTRRLPIGQVHMLKDVSKAHGRAGCPPSRWHTPSSTGLAGRCRHGREPHAGRPSNLSKETRQFYAQHFKASSNPNWDCTCCARLLESFNPAIFRLTSPRGNHSYKFDTGCFRLHKCPSLVRRRCLPSPWMQSSEHVLQLQSSTSQSRGELLVIIF